MISKKEKNSRSQYFNSWYKKSVLQKNSNYLCTGCTAAAEKLLKVDCEEMKEKEQDEDYHQQTPTDNELETIVDSMKPFFVSSSLPFCPNS